MISYETWAQHARIREDHVGEMLRRVDRCDPMHPRAYMAPRYTKNYCPTWRAWLVAQFRKEVYGDPWAPIYTHVRV